MDSTQQTCVSLRGPIAPLFTQHANQGSRLRKPALSACADTYISYIWFPVSYDRPLRLSKVKVYPLG
jgi:hypothetical protein